MVGPWRRRATFWRPWAGVRRLGVTRAVSGRLAEATVLIATRPMTASMNHRLNSPRAALLSLLLGLVVMPLACDGGGPTVNETGACTTDEDCKGARCHEGRFCVQSPAVQSDVVLRIQPPVSSGMVLEQFVTTIGGPDHDQPRKWDLTPPAVIHGIVSRGLLAGSVPGTLVATRPGTIAGTKLSYKATSFTSRKFTLTRPRKGGGTEERSYGFQFGVQPGYAYDVLFWPQIDDIPPYYTKRFVGGASDIWQIELPEEEQLVVVSGRIVAGPGEPPNCESDVKGPACAEGCAGVAGLKVRLADAHGRLRSTRTVTGSDGAFTIHADPAGEKVWLKFRPDEVDTTLPYGTLALPIDLSILQGKGVTKLELGDLYLGALPTPSAMVEFQPQVVNAQGKAVAGARATLRQPWLSPQVCVGEGGSRKPVPAFQELYFERTGLTNAKGHLAIMHHGQDLEENKGDKSDDAITYSSSLRLPAGVATASVLPPPLAGGGAWRGEVTIVAAKPGDKKLAELKLPCPQRPQVRGSVTDFRGLEVASPTVLFKPLMGSKPKCAGIQAEMFPRPEAPVVVLAHDAGDYDAFLDPGRYAVLVEPPEGSGLARALITVINVCPLEPGAAGGAITAKVVDLTVPPPSLLSGKVHGPAGAAMAGVVIDVLAGGLSQLQPPNDAPSPEPSQKRNVAQLVVDTQVIGSAVTDASGQYEILVAAGQLAPKP